MPPEKGIGNAHQTPFEALQKGKNYLFAIGINAYSDFTPLLNARKDIEDMAALLTEHYYFDPNHILLLCDEHATRENIIDELEVLGAQIQPEDRLLIYYSGHGFRIGERGFWIPVDAKRNRFGSYISNAEVRDIIQAIKARHILLISDSCFSASLLVRDASRDIGKTFQNWDKDPSRYVFISGKGVVSDGEKGKNSPFAAGILKHLRHNEAEALNIVSLADQVTKEIQFNYEQQAEISPLFQAGHGGGQFIFFKKQTERDDWQSALLKNTEGGYLAYLDKYENGQFVPEAEAKLLVIADEKEWQVATLQDAAFYYRQYLRKFRNGKYAETAHTQLNVIREQEENDRKERERLAQLEAERKEHERLAKLETDRKEYERLAQLEADRKERERLAQLKADKKEHERLAKLEADKKEQEHLAKLETDKKEQERLAQIETDKKEKARLARLEAKRKEEERLKQLEEEKKEREQNTHPSFFERNKASLGGIGVLIGGLLIYQFILKPMDTPSVNPPVSGTEQTTQSQTNQSQPVDATPQNTSSTANPLGDKTIGVRKLPPNVTVGKAEDEPKTTTTKLTQSQIDEAKRISKLMQDAAVTREEEERQKQLRATQFVTAKGYLNTAAAKADAHDKVKTLEYLQKAASVNGLPQSVLDAINLAKAKVDSGDFEKAGDWIDKAAVALK